MFPIRTTMSAALGAAGMYFLDPRSGRRRRARARDACEHAAHASLRGLDIATRDLWHRAHGVVAEVRGTPQRLPEDDVLVERIRAKLGRLSLHPHAIHVKCHEGRVALGGAIFAGEAARVISAIRAIRGVVEVEDRLERRDASSFQGGARRRRVAPAYWPPAARLLVGGAGTALVVYGVLRRGLTGALAAAFGTGVLARSIANAAFGTLLGVHPRGIAIGKSIKIDAPLEDVFAYFTAFENFPRFTRNVIEVKSVADNRWHWKVRGPAGLAFEWDALVMEQVPGKFVSWTSTESASVRHTGSATFEPTDSGTRMTIRLRYQPPVGVLGHEIARLFGADPKHELDVDLLRFKSLMEQGKATGRGGTVTRDDLTAAPH
jgi:uncharacterized membrane protein